MDKSTTAPLTCRWRLHHSWSWVCTDDGERYERCTRCGRDRIEYFGYKPGTDTNLGLGGPPAPW